MPARQHDAAVIHFRPGTGGTVESGYVGSLHQRAATGGTPVADGFFAKQGVAMGTDPVHI